MDLEEAIEITTALYESCIQNNRPPSKKDDDVNNIQKYLVSLKENKPFQARSHFSQVSFGGMGCFNDWLPRVIYKSPKNKYSGQSFKLICKEWIYTMRKIQA